MLSLFKLPFWGRKNDDQDLFPADNIAHGIFKNYLSRTEIGRNGTGEKASRFIENEFRSLRQSLSESTPCDRYDLIYNSLRRIDQKLGGI